jgi:hypothetical protein
MLISIQQLTNLADATVLQMQNTSPTQDLHLQSYTITGSSSTTTMDFPKIVQANSTSRCFYALPSTTSYVVTFTYTPKDDPNVTLGFTLNVNTPDSSSMGPNQENPTNGWTCGESPMFQPGVVGFTCVFQNPK